MRQFSKTITAAGATAIMLAAILAGSARFARAQDFNVADGSGAHGNRGQIASQPEASSSTANFSGCWDGTGAEGDVYDEWVGNGIGWIGIAQKGASLKGGKKGSYYEFVWANGDCVYGQLSGKADADGFQATGLAGGTCRVSFVASPSSSNDIYGVYGIYGCGSFDYHVGIFELTADSSGCANIIP